MSWWGLITGIAAVCGISTFLAILMVIADATMANYGQVEVTINQEKN